MDPAAAARILATLDALDPLGDLPRTGWVVRGVVPCESIAAHTTAVALLVAMIVDALRADGTAIDGERALRMALVHDAPEAKTGDVPMPHKTPAMTAALDELEARLAAELLTPELHAAWIDHAGTSIEARVVSAADKIQMLAKLSLYERQGRARGAAFDGMWANPANLRALELAPVRALYQAIFARAGRVMPAAT
jgi:putative hydrolases of HD superfamily